MRKNHDIIRKLLPICYLIDSEVSGLDQKIAKIWAKSNAIRHAYTVDEIIKYAKRKNKKKLKILNASGINCGHQDVSIADYLNNNTDFETEWTVFESPNNKYLQNTTLSSLIRKNNIFLNLADFKNTQALYGEKKDYYDIVIFTEIAEHLEHSVLLNCLQSIREKLNHDGIIILTTPNLLSFVNRFYFVCGKGDVQYYGEGIDNMELGLFGHIVLYDLKRMQKILKDSGFNILKADTFNDNYGGDKTNFTKKIVLSMIEFCTFFVKNSGRRLFIVAEKSARVPIPVKT